MRGEMNRRFSEHRDFIYNKIEDRNEVLSLLSIETTISFIEYHITKSNQKEMKQKSRGLLIK